VADEKMFLLLYCRQERLMTENGLYVLSPNPVYDVVGEGAPFTRLYQFYRDGFWSLLSHRFTF